MIKSFIQRQYSRLLSRAQGYYEPILDVSKWQVSMDWQTAWARGVRLVCLRLSVGDYNKDTEFDNFYDAARLQGMKIGAYHVTKPSISIESQWNFILSSLGNRTLDFFVLDNELHDDQSVTIITNTIEGLTVRAHDHFGYYPTQYTRASWWNSYTRSRPIFGLCPLWIARYNAVITHPWNDAPDLRPRDWLDWVLWQWSADGNGQGAYYGAGSASIDLNRANAPDLVTTLSMLTGQAAPELIPVNTTINAGHQAAVNSILWHGWETKNLYTLVLDAGDYVQIMEAEPKNGRVRVRAIKQNAGLVHGWVVAANLRALDAPKLVRAVYPAGEG